jgi:hypothetical protein
MDVQYLAMLGSVMALAAIFGFSWIQVARLKYGGRSELDALKGELGALEETLQSLPLKDLDKIPDMRQDIIQLKLKLGLG